MFGKSASGVEFLTDWQIGDALMRIITQARQRLILVSPYNRHWGHLRREVAAAQGRGVAVRMYYRADEPSPSAEHDDVASIPIRMLHAKIYSNETTALITTMNLVEASATHSREVGLLIRDRKLLSEVAEYVESLLDTGSAVSENGSGAASAGMRSTGPPAARPVVRTATEIAEYIKASGYCIECREPKDFDLTKPLCVPCYTRRGRNGTHKVCHECGESYASHINEPLCLICAAARPTAGV